MEIGQAVQVLQDWGATREEVCRVLNVSGDANAWSGDTPILLGTDTSERVMLIELITDYLRVLFPQDHLRWPRLRNDAPLFDGATPLSVLATGKISDIREVKRWLAGWVHG